MRRGPLSEGVRERMADGGLAALVGFYGPPEAVLESIDRWEAGAAESSLLDRGVFAACEAVAEGMEDGP